MSNAKKNSYLVVPKVLRKRDRTMFTQKREILDQQAECKISCPVSHGHRLPCVDGICRILWFRMDTLAFAKSVDLCSFAVCAAVSQVGFLATSECISQAVSCVVPI